MCPGYIKNKEFSLKGSRDKVHVNWLGFLCERPTRRSRRCREGAIAQGDTVTRKAMSRF